MTEAFPLSPDELDDAWLAEATGKAGGSWRTEPVTGGFWSRMVRAVHDDGTSVVLKWPDRSEQARFVCGLFEFNRIELGVYRDAADRVRAPRLVHLEHSDDHGEYVLVMDDLGGQRQFDQLRGCPPDRAVAVVDALAELHARNWADPGLDDLDWLPAPTDPLIAERVPGIVAAVSEPAFANLSDVPAEITEAWPRLIEALPTLLDGFDDTRTTLAHGDVRLTNLFFDGDRVSFVDWQVARRTHGAYDLAYFCTQSLDTATRRTHEAALLERYRTALAGHGIDAPAPDALGEAYRRSALYCLVYPIIAASSAADGADPQALEVASRAFTAALDLDAPGTSVS